MRHALLFVLSCSGNVSSGGKQDLNLGEDCTDGTCSAGATCNQEGICELSGEIGTFEEGDDCSDTAECAYSLVCSSQNLCATPGDPGTGATGDACGGDDDCQAGFLCGEGGSCEDLGIPYWEGVSACPADDSSFYAVFTIPRLPVSGESDFYAFPFPNDYRRDTSGHPELSGYPTPGATAPAVDQLLAAISSEVTGFGVNPTVYFRFSQAVDGATFTALTSDATIHFVSLDEEADDYGELPALRYFTRASRGKYICNNWLAVSPYEGRPLLENHTYAVWISKGVKNKAGDAATSTDDLALVLGDTRADGLANGLAWDAYAPLRSYLSDKGIATSDLLSAAVFSTGAPSSRARYFEDVLPEVTADGLLSCENGGDNVCGTCEVHTGMTEVHGQLTVPSYPAADGSVAFDAASGRPVADGEEAVCFALTVPEGEAPADGWPVVVYAPDLGGDFRSAITDGVAAAMADAGIATLTVDPPQHGIRGAGIADYLRPDDPPAWEGNVLQHVADLTALAVFAGELSWSDVDSPTGTAVTLDPDLRFLVGHGQGATAATPVLAWSRDIPGGVLGNPSGWYVAGLSETFAPYDLGHALQAAFADSSLDVHHPVNALLQLYFEGIDPVSYAPGVVREPLTEAKHLWLVEGVADEELPALARGATIDAYDLPTVGTVLEDRGQSTTGSPASENVNTEDGSRTAGASQYAGGHDALLEEALSGIVTFVQGTPEIGP